ncbi:hypothetical protein I302_107501 [Kwoniella bestiolae CBS 10118]|uniref:Short-chain dehydrogenase n=1 Tax=Kwoniella bestiolae CBS 10118 TaxID=1296100 RepID=A0A1B9FYD0_9TREE|nr:hypothetical protein I302_06758 [Kwoniella bestiolae CBS 10118]OCF23774.1 hypothetical protein I302_06758 [Kwoniella bestiolae CBS 10118]
MSGFATIFRQFFPSQPTWSVEDLPDQTGRVAIVTGGNTGIGKYLCEALLEKNATVYLLARSEEKALAAIEDLKSKTNRSNIHFIRLDLADLSTIKQTVTEFTNMEIRLDLLFNNAGVQNPPNGSKTVQGWDLQLGVNALGPILLTSLLLPTLLDTAKRHNNEGFNNVRIINTSSVAHVLLAPKGGLNWEDPNLGFKDANAAYGQSKFVNVAHAVHFARTYGDRGLSCHAINPGNIQSELMRHRSWTMQVMTRPILWPIEYGTLSALWAGLSLEAGKQEQNGSYYIPWGRKGEPNPAIKDTKHVERM